MTKKKVKKSALKKLDAITAETNQLCLGDDEEEDNINNNNNNNNNRARHETSTHWKMKNYMGGSPSPTTGRQYGSTLPASRDPSHGGLGTSRYQSTTTPSCDGGVVSGELTPKDISDLSEIFDIFDSRACGTIPFHDLLRALRFLRFPVTEGEVNGILKTLHCNNNNNNNNKYYNNNNNSNKYSNNNNNNKYTVEVFMRCVVECERARSDWGGQIADVFDNLHVEGTRGITASDLQRINAARGLGLSDVDIEEMVSLADMGGDGVVDQHEFVEVMLKTNLFRQ